MDKDLQKYLEDLGIRYTEYKHPAVFTVAESKKLALNIPGLHTKNLFLRDENKKFYLLVCPGDKRMNLKSLKKHLKIKELNFGNPDELKKILNISPGSVSLFCLIHAKQIHLIIDKEVWLADSVGFHPNANTSTLVISHSDLEKFYNSINFEKEVIEIE